MTDADHKEDTGADSIEERLVRINDRIGKACVRAGRVPDDVVLLPITKGVTPDRIAEAARCGLTVFGESKVQEARHKIPMCAGNLTWHMIGHLQSNKIRDAVWLFSAIQAIDSLKLLQMVNEGCEKAGKSMPVALEINVGGEGTKFGMNEADAAAVLQACNELSRVEVTGLMAIPPITADPEGARPFFRRLREIRDRLRDGSGFELRELSMGMSHDFEVAIEEGATTIRLGTIIFGKREAMKQ